MTKMGSPHMQPGWSAPSHYPTADVQPGQSNYSFWKQFSRTINSKEIMYYPQNIIWFYLHLLTHVPKLELYKPVWLHDQWILKPLHEGQKSSFKMSRQLTLGPKLSLSLQTPRPKAGGYAHVWVPLTSGCSVRFAMASFLLRLERS